MKFVDKLLGLIASGFNKMIDGFLLVIQFFAKPLSYLLEFLKGIFYFIYKLGEVAVAVIKLFVALFQFFIAIIAGIFRTIKSWLTINPSAGDVSFPSVSNRGFGVVMDILQPTGLLTVVPIVALAFVWFFFAMRVVSLFGGSIYLGSPAGKGGSE